MKGSGTKAELPVTNSMPSSTIMMSPTGNMIAPTCGCPVVNAPLNAKLVATPKMAPDMIPRINRLEIGSASFLLPVSTIDFATSAGLT